VREEAGAMAGKRRKLAFRRISEAAADTTIKA
jgi:hypothetical protein